MKNLKFFLIFLTVLLTSEVFSEVAQQKIEAIEPPTLSSDGSYITLCTSPNKKYAIAMVRVPRGQTEYHKHDPVEQVVAFRFMRLKDPKTQWSLGIEIGKNEIVDLADPFKITCLEENKIFVSKGSKLSEQTPPYSFRLGKSLIEKWNRTNHWKGDSAISYVEDEPMSYWNIDWSEDGAKFLIHWTTDGDSYDRLDAYAFEQYQDGCSGGKLVHLSHLEIDQAYQTSLSKYVHIRQPWQKFYNRLKEYDSDRAWAYIEKAYFKKGDLEVVFSDTLVEKNKDGSEQEPKQIPLKETLQFHFNSISDGWISSIASGEKVIVKGQAFEVVSMGPNQKHAVVARRVQKQLGKGSYPEYDLFLIRLADPQQVISLRISGVDESVLATKAATPEQHKVLALDQSDHWRDNQWYPYLDIQWNLDGSRVAICTEHPKVSALDLYSLQNESIKKLVSSSRIEESIDPIISKDLLLRKDIQQPWNKFYNRDVPCKWQVKWISTHELLLEESGQLSPRALKTGEKIKEEPNNELYSSKILLRFEDNAKMTVRSFSSPSSTSQKIDGAKR